MATLPPPAMPTTVLQALVAALARAGAYNRNVMVAPAAVLWPDEQCQWEPILPWLREVVPHLLTLGPYDPDKRIGPAIWIRCMLGRTLDAAAAFREDTIPIVYLPGVGKAALRAIETCAKSLQPIAELQYRGVFFSQQNGRDWTLTAFLKSSDGGLGLDVAQDQKTLAALTRAVLPLADTPLAALAGKRLEAADFDQLLTPDPVRDLLRWLDDPKSARTAWDESRWQAFRARCKDELGFDPQTDGELVGAERLCGRSGPWLKAWSRFAESPRIYPGLTKLLRRVAPPQDLFGDLSSYPQVNDKREEELRKALAALDGSAPHDAVKTLGELEQRHGSRRSWVWAELGEAPLAQALAHLAKLAAVAGQDLGGGSPEEMAELYRNGAWEADAAVLGALGGLQRGEDVTSVRAAIRAVYLPWVERAAQRLQELVGTHGFPGASAEARTPVEASAGECIFFADGLRYDIGQMLAAELGRRGHSVTTQTRWIGLPSVTATSKPAVSPIAGGVAGAAEHDAFQPSIAATGKPLTTDAFRKLLKEAGYQALDREQTGDPAGRGWTEHGDLDHSGHEEQWKLARRVDEQLREMVERLEALFAAGWKRLTIVTDHGWLLVPGGLPKVELPHYLVETRWGRCAVLKAAAQHGAGTLVLPWRWHDNVRVALAPGISNFYEGSEYAHGGLSLQECLTPVLRVTQSGAAIQVTVASPTWRGMRCRVQVMGGAAGLRVDLRTKAGDPTTSLVNNGKALDPAGSASLLVEDDETIGAAVVVVVLDTNGTVLAKKTTTVGED